MAVSEYAVTFYKEGGHNHDGENSTKINTTVYSVFDFTFTPENPTDSESNTYRLNNVDVWKRFVVSTVNESLLNPAGIVIGANSINSDNILAGSVTADKIEAGAVTADKLEAELVLVNQQIRSNNYNAGSAGWSVFSNGYAEFGNVEIRGTGEFSGSLTANSGNIAGWNITSTRLSSGNAFISSDASANGIVFWTGNSTATSAPFRVRSNGFITAESGTIGGWTLSNNRISSVANTTVFYSNGVITAAGATFSLSTFALSSLNSSAINDSGIFNGPGNQFTVSNTGSLSSVLGTVGGLGISTTSLAAGGVTFSSGGQISAQSGGRGVVISPGENAIQMKANGNTIATIKASNPNFGGTQLTFDTGSIYCNNTTFFTIAPSSGTAAVTVPLPTQVGTSYLVSIGNVIYKTGSRRELKNNISPINSAINIINSLNPVSFYPKVNENEPEIVKYLNSINKRYGFVVQDIEEVDTSLLNYDYVGSNISMTIEDWEDPTNFAAVNYDMNGILSLLTRAVQELSAEVESLKNRLGEN